MSKVILRPGDVFCSSNPMMLGRAINAVQAFWARDDKSKYSHSGIIIDRNGTTFECLWTIKKQNLYYAYKNDYILIGRHKGMTPHRFIEGYRYIRHHEGQWYPFWRLPLHLVPPIAKKIHIVGRPVCSELCKKMLFGAKLVPRYAGATPDEIADEIINWNVWEIIYEGETKWLRW